MKILFVGYHNKNFMTITEYIERAIVDLGHTLEIADYRDWHIPGRIRDRVGFLDAMDRKRINQDLVKHAQRFKPDLLLVNGGWTIYPETIISIKAKHKTITANWIADYPNKFDEHLRAGPAYDYFFTSGTDSLLKYQQAGHRNGHWLPFACDAGIHRPVELTAAEKARYACDICFVGSCYTERLEILQHLAQFNVGIWGSGWEKLPVHSPLRQFIRGASLQPEEWVKSFSGAKIVLNIIGHRCDVMTPYVPEHEFRMTNTKVFEILGCNAFQLVDAKADVAALFKDGQHLAIYQDGPTLVERVKYYLNNEQERAEIALRGREEVLSHHTYQHRIKEIVSVIQQGQ